MYASTPKRIADTVSTTVITGRRMKGSERLPAHLLQRQGDKETRGQGEAAESCSSHLMSSHLVSLSPCPLVSFSPTPLATAVGVESLTTFTAPPGITIIWPVTMTFSPALRPFSTT